jgi:carboxyl-terminal processing protease
VAVSDAFLDKGEIVSTRGRRSDDAQRYNARAGDIAQGLPVAILMGTRSFGKGSVQTIIPLAGHGAMRLTTARYYTPSGRSIQAKGIDPDIVVEAAKIEHTAAKDDKAKTAAADDKTKKPDADDKAKKSETAAEPQNTVDPSIIGTPNDYQLARAVDMLRGIALFNGRVIN